MDTNSESTPKSEPKFKKNLYGKREGSIASLWVTGSGVEKVLDMEQIPRESLYELAFAGWKDFVSNRAPKGCAARTKGEILEEITLKIEVGESLVTERMSVEERAINALLNSDKAKNLTPEQIELLKKIGR